MAVNIQPITASFGTIGRTKKVSKSVALTDEEKRSVIPANPNDAWMGGGGGENAGSWQPTTGNEWGGGTPGPNGSGVGQTGTTNGQPNTPEGWDLAKGTKTVEEEVATDQNDWLSATGATGLNNKTALAKNLGYKSGDLDAWIKDNKSFYDTAVAQNFNATRTDTTEDDLNSIGASGWLSATNGDGLSRGSRLVLAQGLGYTGNADDASVIPWLNAPERVKDYTTAVHAMRGEVVGQAPTVGGSTPQRYEDLTNAAKLKTATSLGSDGLDVWMSNQSQLTRALEALDTPFTSAVPNEDKTSKASRLTQDFLRRQATQPVQSGLRNSFRRSAVAGNSLFGA